LSSVNVLHIIANINPVNLTRTIEPNLLVFTERNLFDDMIYRTRDVYIKVKGLVSLLLVDLNLTSLM